MNFVPQAIPGVLLIEPQIYSDHRGNFFESFRLDLLEEVTGHTVSFVQDNESTSSRGVLRGLHFQTPPHAQSKLVRVVQGEVLDVAVDIRRGSPTYAQSIAVRLSAQNKRQLFVPRGLAHGFVVLSETATFSYKVDNYYAPKYDCGVRFDDPQANIDWVLGREVLQLSDKDKKLPLLEETPSYFVYQKPDDLC